MLNPTDIKAATDAFMAKLATTSLSDIKMRDVADAADLPLAKLVMTFPSRLGLVEAFAADIDSQILAGDDPDMGEEPARERLFDVFMRRFDALLAFKPALIQLERDIKRDPALAVSFARIASTSMTRMAASADLDVDGARGAIVKAGLLTVYARVMRVFLAESDEGQARTMAELDKALRQAERRIGDLDSLMARLRGEGGSSGGPLCRLRDRMRQRSANDDADPAPKAA